MEKAKTVMTVCICTAFITSFSGSALNPSIPAMSEFFGMGAAAAGWIITAYMVVIAAFSAPVGKLADTRGRRNVLIIGISIFLLTSVAAIFAKEAWFILFVRGVQGIGSAMIFATNMPIAVQVFPPEKRGHAIGKVTAGVYTGLAIGPAIGGILNNHFGWQAVFVFASAVSVLALILAVKYLDKDIVDSSSASVDYSGAVVYMLMISMIIIGLTLLNSINFSWLILGGGFILIALFAGIELKTANPIIDVRIFKNEKAYTLSNLTALFNYSATFGMGYLVSIYAQVVHGFSSQTAGFILMAQPIFMAVLTPRAGSLSDRIKPYLLASCGMGFCACALIILSFAAQETSLVVIIIALSIAGIGIALFSSPNTNVIMSCVKPKDFGVANSVLSTMRTTGQASGMAIITIIVSGSIGNVSLYDANCSDVIGTMHTSFAVFTVLCIAGIFMSLARKKQ